jgi:hypothetical protein
VGSLDTPTLSLGSADEARWNTLIPSRLANIIGTALFFESKWPRILDSEVNIVVSKSVDRRDLQSRQIKIRSPIVVFPPLYSAIAGGMMVSLKQFSKKTW